MFRIRDVLIRIRTTGRIPFQLILKLNAGERNLFPDILITTYLLPLRYLLTLAIHIFSTSGEQHTRLRIQKFPYNGIFMNPESHLRETFPLLCWKTSAGKQRNTIFLNCLKYLIVRTRIRKKWMNRKWSRTLTAFALKEVVGLRDILVRIRVPGSVPLTNGSGSKFGSNSGSDSGSFFQWLQGCKKYFFFPYLFLINFLAGTLSAVLKLNFLHYFSLLNTFNEKRQGSGAGSIPLANGSKSGRPKNMRIRIPTTAKRVDIWANWHL